MVFSKQTQLHRLFENENIIAFDKPAGLPVAPEQHGDPQKSLMGPAQTSTGLKLWLVHIIDKGTSGTVVFAKNEKAHNHISAQFQKGLARKTYLALLNGRLEDDSGTINEPIIMNGKDVARDADGQTSITDYKVIERFRDFTLVEAYPGTGGRHQIRLHFLSIGHPLAIDTDYSGRAALFLSEFKKRYKPSGEEKPLLSRLSLHVKGIILTEPDLNTPITIESPLPHDFEITVKHLRKYNK